MPTGPGAGGSRARAFREILAALARLERIRGVLIVTPDGLVIASHLPSPAPAEALAALGAALGRELELGEERLGRGTFRTASFSAADGTIVVGAGAVGFLVLVGDRDVDLASVRPALIRALGRLRG